MTGIFFMLSEVGFLKKQSDDKPDSVLPLREVSVIYLNQKSPPGFVDLRPTPIAFYPLPRTSNPHNGSLHELAASKMHSQYVTILLVGSYPAFSPLPATFPFSMKHG